MVSVCLGNIYIYRCIWAYTGYICGFIGFLVCPGHIYEIYRYVWVTYRVYKWVCMTLVCPGRIYRYIDMLGK